MIRILDTSRQWASLRLLPFARFILKPPGSAFWNP